MAIALKLEAQLKAAGYKVNMTKRDSTSCPTFRERWEQANNAGSNIFVSIHLNAPSSAPFGLFHGSSVIYNSAKTSAKKLAELMVDQIASNVGVNNRGAKADNTLAVLKPNTTRMTAVLAEIARLSSPDEDIMHDPGSADKAAAGILSGIDAFINQ